MMKVGLRLVCGRGWPPGYHYQRHSLSKSPGNCVHSAERTRAISHCQRTNPGHSRVAICCVGGTQFITRANMHKF